MDVANYPNLTPKPKPFESAMEVMAWLVLAFIWLFAGWEYLNLPDTIPIHFDMLGKADEYGGKSAAFTMPILATLLLVGLSFLQRSVPKFNTPEDRTPEDAQKQAAFAIKGIRIAKVVALFLFGGIEVFISRWSRGLEFSLYLLIPVVIIIIAVPVCYFVFKAKKKNNG